jgi:hypothetical protein
MASINYMMATIAACDASYVQQALQHVEGLAAELRDKAGAATTRYGVLSTGEQAGSLVLFQTYEELNGIDRAFNVYAESSDYQSIITSGKIQVRLRNIVKLEALQVQNPSSDMPAYGVVTRIASSDPMMDRMEQLVPLFEENGAMVIRYGTLVTGENAGKRLLGVGYPSMDAIEKTYDALRASDTYTSMLGEVDLEVRNIIRFVG